MMIKYFKKITLVLLIIFLSSCKATYSNVENTEIAVEETSQPTNSENSYINSFSYPFERAQLSSFNGGDNDNILIDAQYKKIELRSGEAFYHSGKIILFNQMDVYTISFDINASQRANLQLLIYDGDNLIEDSSVYEIDSNSQRIEYSFTYPASTTWSGELVIKFNSAEVNDITIVNLLINNDSQKIYNARINQIGYKPDCFKSAVFNTNAGEVFYIRDASSNAIVYCGYIGNGREDKNNGEYNYLIDFSDFKDIGEYYIQSETGLLSYAFKIGDDIYNNLYGQTIHFLTLQRCGQDLNETVAADYSHPACHSENARLYTTLSETYLDIRGGWHDAGDYGRYVQTGAKTLACLLLAQYFNPDIHDDYNLPESNNGIPDILDEARYELEWLLKMQSTSNTVYNKATSKNFADFTWPQDDHEEVYILPTTSITTASFAGVMALAAKLYRNYDDSFAKICQQASIKAINALNIMESAGIDANPDGFTSGDFLDDSDQDERFFAYACLYDLTAENKYLDEARKIFYSGNLKGTLSASMTDYGIAILLEKEIDDNFYSDLLNNIKNNAYSAIERLNNNNYPYPLIEYNWGSNMHVAENIFILELCYRATKDKMFHNYASAELAYILGENGLDLSFVTGFGSRSPNTVHHRITYITNKVMNGALVGGVDQYLSDGISNNVMNESTPIAKRYSSDFNSYSTNEVAINYNGALILALSFFTN